MKDKTPTERVVLIQAETLACWLRDDVRELAVIKAQAGPAWGSSILKGQRRERNET